MAEISIAFLTVKEQADRIRKPDFGWSTYIRPVAFLKNVPRDLSKHLESISKSVEELRADLVGLMYQLDPRKHRAFRAKSVWVARTLSGTQIGEVSPDVTLRECHEAFDFVVESALRIQELYEW